MTSTYEKELRSKSMTFINIIAEKTGLDAAIDEGAWQEYSVILSVMDVAQFNLYYSPKRDFYSLFPKGKIDKDLRAQIMGLWEALASDEAKADVLAQSETDYQAFVDGAYDKDRKSVGYGVVILKAGEEVTRLSGAVNKYQESHQIAGELAATMRVLSWCKQQGINAIDLFFDYQGIEKWATGAYKAKNAMAQEYKAYVRDSGVKVHWHKVKSHTGVYWNEVADKLAKAGTKTSV